MTPSPRKASTQVVDRIALVFDRDTTNPRADLVESSLVYTFAPNAGVGDMMEAIMRGRATLPAESLVRAAKDFPSAVGLSNLICDQVEPDPFVETEVEELRAAVAEQQRLVIKLGFGGAVMAVILLMLLVLEHPPGI